MPHTLANTLAAHESIYVNSGHPMCCKSTKLDIQALIDRLGPNHGSMHQDLVGCSAARIARLRAGIAGGCFSRWFLITRASRPRAIASGSRPSREGLGDFSLS